MEPLSVYYPARKKGLFFHILAALFFAALSGISMWLAIRQAVGSYFVLLLILSLGLVVPFAVSAYNGYSLAQASYVLERDGLLLRWGLRAEDIPIVEVEWVRPATELAYHLKLPFMRFPGAVLGTVNSEGLGLVEFLASDFNALVLIATPRKIFAISPANPAQFISDFQRNLELGSLSPIPSATTLPAAYLQSVWADRRARTLMLTGLILSLALFILTSLIIPTRASISLGFTNAGVPIEPGPPEQLLLLPVLGALTFFLDFLAGLYFYRHHPLRPAAFLLWIGGVLTPLLLIAAVLFLT